MVGRIVQGVIQECCECEVADEPVVEQNVDAHNTKHKHVDDHAMAFHPTDPDFVLMGSDGGYIANFPPVHSYA